MSGPAPPSHPHPINSPPPGPYGFVGIGVMGYGMALNLRRKLPPTTPLIICEINTVRRNQFVTEVYQHSLGPVEVVDTPRQLAERAGVIITMLPKAPHVEAVFNGPNGFLTSPNLSARFFIECSSINTTSSTRLATHVTASGHAFIDAPVSGGPQGSAAGTLTFMVGGPLSLYNRAFPVLSLMGAPSAIFHCGPPGAGLATKQLNNYLSYTSYIALCEVMATGLLYGLDPKTLADVINKSSGMNWNSLHHNPVKGVNPEASSARDFRGGFSTELAAGVVGDAVGLMEIVGTRSVLAERVRGVFERAVDDERTRGMEARSVWWFFEGGKGEEGVERVGEGQEQGGSAAAGVGSAGEGRAGVYGG